MPRRRDVYLKIEKLPGYSPVAPDDAEHDSYRLDCLHGPGHEDGKIPDAEVEMRRLDALVYREYLDAAYTVPNTAKLVAADINEPRFDRRIPGAVLYTQPGERLCIHVLNGDDSPHSFHLHGLAYGIDSDGSWPFGVDSADGRRSDEICPGSNWTYVFDATEETIGAWPFHDHHMNVMASVNRGLFGAVIVRDPHCDKADYEAPFFLHRLAGPRRSSLFDSGTLNPGQTFSHTFTVVGTFDYACRFHPMQGKVRVALGGAANQTITIADGPSRFDPADVSVAPGAVVTWVHAGAAPHTVTESGGGGMDSFAINGRSFVGNTPTIVVDSGKRIRWYVLNLDLDMMWHNFHPHGQRWAVAGEALDTRSLGPAESFVVDTIAPPVILLPAEGYYEEGHGPEHPKERKRVHVQGDFLVHCHVEPHMMSGMAALVRAVQQIELTEELEKELGFVPPVKHPHHGCAHVDMRRCARGGEGTWEPLPDSPIFVVHAAVLHTAKVLLFSGTAEVGYPLESRVFDPQTRTFTTQLYGEDLFCSGHAFLADGRLCVAGGAPIGVLRSTHIFNPVGETWTKVADMSQGRWYPTVLTLSDGRILAVSGSGIAPIEVYNPGGNAWQTVAGAARMFPELYPSLHLLPSGDVFYSRAGWSVAAGSQTAYLRFTGPAAGSWTDLGQQQFPERQEGTAVILIDTTVSPPSAKIFIIGGGVSGGPTTRNSQSCEFIDLTTLTPAPAWQRAADMNFQRTNVSGVVLPNGTILAVGGQRNGKWAADPQPVLGAEIYNPQTNTWTLTAPMQHPRQYHSIAVLLPDGRVLAAGGVDPTKGGAPARDQRFLELFNPPYLFQGSRPVIGGAPPAGAYGASLNITTPDAARVDSVTLLRPCSMTHHTDAGQRYIKLPITARGAGQVTVQAPANGNIAPPGFYLLFLVTAAGVHSEARFIRLS